MSKGSMGEIIAIHLENNGDRYDLGNSLSIRVLATNLSLELQDAGYGSEGELCD
jgi:hypothetical protein